MASNISNMMNSKIRMSGLSSGLDTDTLIKQMLSNDNAKVNKVKQDRQVLQWKRDNYRGITNLIRAFKDEYFDVLKPSTNFRSPSAFSTFNTSYSKEGVVVATAGTGAASGSHSINVKSLATAAKIEGESAITASVTGSSILPVGANNLQGKQIDVTLDGITKTIDLENYSDRIDMESKLQIKLNQAFGANKLKVDATTTGKLQVSTLIAGSSFKLSETTNSFVNSLGFSNGQQNFITGAEITVADKADLNGTFKVTLGGIEKEIELTGLSNINVLDDVRGMIQAKLDDNSSDSIYGKITVALNGNKLELTTKSGDKLVLASGSSNSNLNKLGFASGATATGTSYSSISLTGNEIGKSFTINVNGLDKVINLDQDESDVTSLAAQIESKLNALGVNTVNAGVNGLGDGLVFSSQEKLILKKGLEDSLGSLGFAATDNKSNRVTLNTGIKSLEKSFAEGIVFNAAANVQFTINGVSINLNKSFENATISDVMTAVNTSSAGVEMRYDSLSDKFTLISKSVGVDSNITFTDTAVDALQNPIGLFKALGIADGTPTAGTDAKFDLDGVDDMIRSSNEFTVDNVTYNLKEVTQTATANPVTINLSANPGDLLDKIKSFVNGYNGLINKINTEISTKRERGYLPLTDEQKEVMKDSEITSWESKAKAGLLNNDPILNKILGSIRSAIYEPITGMSTSLAQIGITTGSYETRGQLIIDEAKLTTALKEKPELVTQLFSKESEVSYNEALGDANKSKTRYQENGIAQRLYDIIQDSTRVTRDSGGYKGSLLEKAGMIGDISDTQNLIYKEIYTKDLSINTLLDKLSTKENKLYVKFAAMEKALSSMNNQSSWLSQQFSGGQ